MITRVFFIAGILLLVALQPAAAEYIIGVADVLDVVFCQQTDLRRDPELTNLEQWTDPSPQTNIVSRGNRECHRLPLKQDVYPFSFGEWSCADNPCLPL